MTFSERMGYKKPKIELQKESMDPNLRNGLWSYLALDIFKDFTSSYELPEDRFVIENVDYLRERIWLDFFKNPIDTISPFISDYVKYIRDWFFNAVWYEVYDFTEFIIENHQDKKQVQKLIEDVNFVLKRELSAYRIVSTIFTPITSDIEISQIEKALDSPIKEVNEHLGRALELLADRKNPDYRNSIKESISAVETMCRKISENPKATLADALNELVKSGKIKLHGAIQSAFKNLYGYTNDADGIRHSLMKEESLDQEDALFMLTSCSAFVNYLTVKTLKSGNKLIK
jgi:hypothetical protein